MRCPVRVLLMASRRVPFDDRSAREGGWAVRQRAAAGVRLSFDGRSSPDTIFVGDYLKLRFMLARFWAEQNGQDLIEYILLSSSLALALAAGLLALAPAATAFGM